MCSCKGRSGTFRSRQGAKALALFIRGMNCTMSYVQRRGKRLQPPARRLCTNDQPPGLTGASSRFSIGALPVMVREEGAAEPLGFSPGAGTC